MATYTVEAFRWSGTGYNSLYNTSYTAVMTDNDPNYQGSGDGGEAGRFERVASAVGGGGNGDGGNGTGSGGSSGGGSGGGGSFEDALAGLDLPFTLPGFG